MFQQTTTALPDLIHLDSVTGKEAVPPSLVTLLQAYSELAAYKTEYATPYFKVLDQLQHTDPDNVTVQAALGSKDLKDGKLSEAVDHLRRSLALDPRQAAVRGLLSAALEKLGRSDEALAEQQRAVAQDPYNPTLQRSLVVLLIHRKQYRDAQAAMRHYLEIFPQDDLMRKMLATAKAETQQQ
jgi:Flp pilus assembly protein TadD